MPLANFKDSALINLILAGRTECFMVLMNRHLPAVRRCIGSMMPNKTNADDVLQEVLIKVWRRLSTFRSESTFRAWMTRVAINEALQWYRRERNSPTCQAFSDSDTFASPDESPLQALTRAETTQIVRNAVVKLPAKYRQVLNLREFEQLRLGEIAESLHTSIPAVKTRLFRARRMLVTVLQRPKDRENRKSQGTTKS
ncbi:MAG: polymerase sigma-70 factor [Bryobacterales bacterium]|nr:polymerase sigma-70 factor [Bryobacterales bacterium]